MKSLYVIQGMTHFHRHASTIRLICKSRYDVVSLFDESWSNGVINKAVLRMESQEAVSI